jgi:hypothetical protein
MEIKGALLKGFKPENIARDLKLTKVSKKYEIRNLNLDLNYLNKYKKRRK